MWKENCETHPSALLYEWNQLWNMPVDPPEKPEDIG